MMTHPTKGGDQQSSPPHHHNHNCNSEPKEVKYQQPAASIQQQRGACSVKFDESAIYLDSLFKTALKYAFRQQQQQQQQQSSQQSKRKNRNPSSSSALSQVSIGIDIVCYGSYNAKMAYVTLNPNNNSSSRNKNNNNNNDDTELTSSACFKSIEMIYDHIGNLRVLPDYGAHDIYLIEQFRAVIGIAFQAFGRRWYELSADEMMRGYDAFGFRLVERNEFPCVCFDESRCYSTNRLVGKFFETMLQCVGLRMPDYDAKLRNLCVTVPSDFHTYQRLSLKNCLETIGLNNYLMVNKSTSLALPFLAKDLDDSSKKFIIDFGSGK